MSKRDFDRMLKPMLSKDEKFDYKKTIGEIQQFLKKLLCFTDDERLFAGSAFVAGSVKIDGTPYAAYNPAAGFPLSDLAAGESTVVEFDVRVL